MILYTTAIERVQILSWEHLLPICFAIVLAVGLIKYAKAIPVEKQQRIIHHLAIFISVIVLIFSWLLYAFWSL